MIADQVCPGRNDINPLMLAVAKKLPGNFGEISQSGT